MHYHPSMLSLEEFIDAVAADPGGVLLLGGNAAAKRAVAERIHVKRGAAGALVVVAAAAPKPRLGGIAGGSTVFLEDASDLGFDEQEALLASHTTERPWKIVGSVEARDELHDAVSEERLRPAVYHLLTAHFYDFDKGLAATAKPR